MTHGINSPGAFRRNYDRRITTPLFDCDHYLGHPLYNFVNGPILLNDSIRNFP